MTPPMQGIYQLMLFPSNLHQQQIKCDRRINTTDPEKLCPEAADRRVSRSSIFGQIQKRPVRQEGALFRHHIFRESTNRCSSDIIFGKNTTVSIQLIRRSCVQKQRLGESPFPQFFVKSKSFRFDRKDLFADSANAGNRPTDALPV